MYPVALASFGSKDGPGISSRNRYPKGTKSVPKNASCECHGRHGFDGSKKKHNAGWYTVLMTSDFSWEGEHICMYLAHPEFLSSVFLSEY